MFNQIQISYFKLSETLNFLKLRRNLRSPLKVGRRIEGHLFCFAAYAERSIKSGPRGGGRSVAPLPFWQSMNWSWSGFFEGETLSYGSLHVPPGRNQPWNEPHDLSLCPQPGRQSFTDHICRLASWPSAVFSLCRVVVFTVLNKLIFDLL